MAKNTKENQKETIKRARKLSLVQMIEAGVIKPGRKLTAFYGGIEAVGFVRKDGTILLKAPAAEDVNNQVFGSISGAARAICQAAGKARPDVDGYKFFGTVVNGKTVPVTALRQQA